MSYSMSFKVKKELNIDEIAKKLQKEIDEEIKLLKEKNILIEDVSVFLNENIPYAPKVNNLVGINLHIMEELSLFYFYHKIISFSEKYGVYSSCSKLNKSEKLPYFYYDEEKTFILENNEYEKIIKSKEKLNINITYRDRFNQPELLHKKLMTNLFRIFIEKDLKKIEKTLSKTL